MHGSVKQVFQHATSMHQHTGLKRRSVRQLPRYMTCASSATLSSVSSGKKNAAFADQDIFLIAGAGIAGLAMAAALIKVCKLLQLLCAHASALWSECTAVVA